MAKDLPYFKFIISEWNDGDVTLCSMEAQGLFVNLCSIYWSQEGELSLAKAKRRFSQIDATVFDELINDRIIKVNGDEVVINFLDEQLEERGKLSEKNAENAAKGWEKRKKEATAEPPHNEPIYLACNIEEKREEQRRREEKKKEKTVAVESKFFGEDVQAAWEDWKKYRKEKKQAITPSTAKKQMEFLGGRAGPEAIAIINQSITNGWTGLFELKTNNNGTHKKISTGISTQAGGRNYDERL